MKDHTGEVRGFTQWRRSWHSAGEDCTDAGALDDVTFGYYTPDGDTSGEMTMAWYDPSEHLTPVLEVDQYGWHALSTFKDVIDALAERDGDDITPEQFCALLVSLGFEDMTEAGSPLDAPPLPFHEQVLVQLISLDANTKSKKIGIYGLEPHKSYPNGDTAHASFWFADDEMLVTLLISETLTPDVVERVLTMMESEERELVAAATEHRDGSGFGTAVLILPGEVGEPELDGYEFEGLFGFPTWWTAWAVYRAEESAYQNVINEDE